MWVHQSCIRGWTLPSFLASIGLWLGEGLAVKEIFHR
jgi:hypothetical protein